jgi:hypothetical protein
LTRESIPSWARTQFETIEAVAQRLDERNVEFWLWGGWAVDFYAGRVTRPHSDIDLILSHSDREAGKAELRGLGFTFLACPRHRLRAARGLPDRGAASSLTRPSRIRSALRQRTPGLLRRCYWRLGTLLSKRPEDILVNVIFIEETEDGVFSYGYDDATLHQWPAGAFPSEKVSFCGVSCRMVDAGTLRHFKLSPHSPDETRVPRLERSGALKDAADLKTLDAVMDDESS